MARFEDYVKKDSLETELDEAEKQEQRREAGTDIPERFKGKSPEEIARAYAELEKLNSRQAQDLGAMRRTVDTLLDLQSDGTSVSRTAPKAEPPAPVTVDDLYQDPDKNIRRVVQEETTGQIKDLDEEVRSLRREQALSKFDALHPDWRDIAQSPEFVNWVRETPFRMRLVAAADKFDLEAADTVINLYKAENGRKQAEQESEAAKQKRERDLRAASLESGGPISHEAVETFSRTDLLQKRLAAKRGNAKADAWLRNNQAKIREAYEDGRITD